MEYILVFVAFSTALKSYNMVYNTTVYASLLLNTEKIH